jgi:hypothetical protein
MALAALALLTLGCMPADGGGAGGTGGAGASGGSGGRSAGAGGTPGTGGAGHAGHDAGNAELGTSADAADAATDHAEVPPEVLAIAGGLQGAFLQLDCAGPEVELQFCAPEAMGKKSVTVKMGGEPGKKYAVALAVWGVMETITYRNGRPGGGDLYIGGESGTPNIAEWGLTTGTETFYLNHFEMCAGEHYTYGIHYESNLITLPGGATLTLFVRDPDNFINTNHMDSQAEDPPPGLAPQLAKIRAMPLQGQYVYVEVVSAQEL